MAEKSANLTPKRKNKHYFFVFLNGPRDPPKTSGFGEKPAEIEKTNRSLPKNDEIIAVFETCV